MNTLQRGENKFSRKQNLVRSVGRNKRLLRELSRVNWSIFPISIGLLRLLAQDSDKPSEIQ
jgi:hypothetical protein